MPDTSGMALTGARVEAVAGKARLANSVLHLFQAGFTASSTTTLAQLLEEECDFDGYVPLTIATWSDPVLAGNGYVIYAPTQTFPWEFGTEGIGNQVGGSFLVLSTGELYQWTNFDPTRACQGVDQAIITEPVDFFPAG